jgi:hypothetical protein
MFRQSANKPKKVDRTRAETAGEPLESESADSYQIR